MSFSKIMAFLSVFSADPGVVTAVRDGREPEVDGAEGRRNVELLERFVAMADAQDHP